MAESHSSAADAPNAMSPATEGSRTTTILLGLAIVLCVCACGLMLLLDPRTLAVNSVYSKF
jgi:hypothetical protein